MSALLKKRLFQHPLDYSIHIVHFFLGNRKRARSLSNRWILFLGGDLTGQIMLLQNQLSSITCTSLLIHSGVVIFFNIKKVNARYCNAQTFTMSFPTICLFGFSTRLPAASNLSFGVWTQGWQTTWKTTPTLLKKKKIYILKTPGRYCRFNWNSLECYPGVFK